VEICDKKVSGKAEILFCQDIGHDPKRYIGDLIEVVAVCQVMFLPLWVFFINEI